MPHPTPEEVLQLANEMVSAQKHLESLQARWSSLFGSASVSPSTERKPGRRTNPNGISARILGLLDDKPDQLFDVSSVHAQLEGSNRKQVESALYNLFAAKKISRPIRGKYQAKDPNR